MTSPETLECRRYVAEGAMYRRSGELDRRLHELERRLRNLGDEVHRVLCESGQVPVETKTGAIARAIETFEAGIDLDEIRGLAERVQSLKGLIDGYEREIDDAATEFGSDEDRLLVASSVA
jgi:hypothetical protein